MGGGDIFALLALLGSTVAGIAFLDWILRNLDDALDDGRDQFSDAFGDMVALPENARAATRKSWGSKGCIEQRPVRTGDWPSHGHHEEASK